MSSIAPLVRISHILGMAERLAIDAEWLRDQLEQPGRSQSGLARSLGLSSPAIVNRMCAGGRKISAEEADKIRAYLASTSRDKHAAGLHIGNTPDLPDEDPLGDYVQIEVLPTFAGMGGGGTGDADRERALLSRRLVEDELRAHPEHLLLVNVRGNSMEPLFRHGDQLLIDKRDTSPTQPGPFALLFDDGYVVKNVEWIEKRTKWRISSANPDFSPEDFAPEDIKIMGRPVWFARRL